MVNDYVHVEIEKEGNLKAAKQESERSACQDMDQATNEEAE